MNDWLGGRRCSLLIIIAAYRPRTFVSLSISLHLLRFFLFFPPDKITRFPGAFRLFSRTRTDPGSFAVGITLSIESVGDSGL